jgi:hypothetical protein
MNRALCMTMLVALPASALMAEGETAGPTGSGTLIVNHVSVNGDARKFREDWWMKDGWSGGIEQLTLEQDLDEHTVLHVEGRGVFDANDYALRLELQRFSVGFIHAGYKQNRTWYDDWGGFYQPFSPPAFRLGRDLYLDDGHVFVDIGLTLPDLPQLTLGYERQFRNGTKSLLEWGSVQQDTTERKIFPSFKRIDETVDIFKADLDHHVGSVDLGNQFRFERYSDKNVTFDEGLTNLTTGASQSVKIHEESQYDLFSNVFHMDSRVNKKVYWSASYLFNRTDGTAGLNLDTTPFAPVSPTLDSVKDWFTRSVNLDQDSHVVNANTLIGPFNQFSFYGGAQAEKTHGSGNTDAELLQLLGTLTNSPLALIRSDTEKDTVEETLGSRFTGIPYTTLYVEGKWQEARYSLSELQTLDSVTNLHLKTTTDVFRQQYTVGFNSAPLRQLNLSAQYRWSRRENNYDNTTDISPGYPGFITEQDFTTDQIVAKLTARPHPKLTMTLQYKLTSTDIHTANKSIVFSGTTLVPAGSLTSGKYDADIYTVSATTTPMSRLYLTGAFTFLDTHTTAFANHVPSVLAYRGNVYTAFGTIGFAPDDKTDVTIDYAFSRSDNFKNNSADGLPLGLDNQRQSLTAGLTRRIRGNILTRLRYGFYEYDQSSNGGIANYSAHFASASCTVSF